MAVGADECVLEDLFGSLGVAGQGVGGPLDQTAMAGEERFERIEVVCLHEAHEIAVRRSGGRLDGLGPVVQRERLQLGDRVPPALTGLYPGPAEKVHRQTGPGQPAAVSFSYAS